MENVLHTPFWEKNDIYIHPVQIYTISMLQLTL